MQKSYTSKYTAVETARLDRLISETDWLKKLKNVVDPIRDEIILSKSANYMACIALVAGFT